MGDQKVTWKKLADWIGFRLVCLFLLLVLVGFCWFVSCWLVSKILLILLFDCLVWLVFVGLVGLRWFSLIGDMG